ncbi:methyltransferase domain-containing protein [Undibacterium sp. TJN25]|uniref:methyltransferase domain-containing protein n=1 Tax=Undibacterium sp. TJN25 TaxID=3413056 RepID=UPI003BF0F5F3
MAIKNNSDFDAAELSKKAEHLSFHRRRAEFQLPKKTGFHSEYAATLVSVDQDSNATGNTNLTLENKPVENVPSHSVPQSVAEKPGIADSHHTASRYLLFAQSGLSLKQRVRLFPGLGYFLAWCNALLRLPRMRQEIISLHRQADVLDTLLRQLTQKHDQLMHLHQVVADQVNELNALKIGLRLQRYDALDVGDRLMKLDRLQIGRQLKSVNQLMRENEAADTRKQTREIALLARISALEQALHSQHTELTPDQLKAWQARAENASSGQSSLVHATSKDFDHDRFYVEFEALFRGTREDIKERLKVYLPYLEHISNQPKNERLAVVDVGCGRGEWLELMDEQHIPATGVDMNAAMVDACLARGFAARCDDAIAYLRELPAGSIAAVTGFHIIEHLPFEILIALFDAALHALAPGGVIIFETPNPENLMVGACNFYYDPTHLHPIVPQVAQFMARQRGFSKAEILRLHPFPEDHQLHGGTDVEAAVNKALFGPQDYAVIGWK